MTNYFNNISTNVAIKTDLFFKTGIDKGSPGGQKRHKPITFDSNSSGSNSKEPRTNRSDNVKLYAPPSGKFSNSVQNYGKL